MSWMHVLIAAGAGGLALFVWNALCWMAFHHHDSDFHRVPKPADVEKALEGAGLGAGMYMLPHEEDYPGGMKDPALHARWAKGPNVFMVVSPPGPCMAGATFGIGFLVNVLEALGCAVAFHYAAVHLPDLGRAVGFTAMLGALVHGGPHLTQAVWMKYPWRHTLKSVFDGVAGFALVGLVLHFIR